MDKNKFDPEKFSLFLKEQAKIIRGQSLTRNQAINIYEQLKSIVKYWQLSGNSPVKDANSFSEGFFEFFLAIEIAHSNYRKENKTMWSNIFNFSKDKLPQFNLKDLMK
ncbi:hypothetical protein HYX07_03785 [Candidatus Woesearchaeota archaeon]|nr:hypothetical protein [Candidatus Woesearchaeota archaeon]